QRYSPPRHLLKICTPRASSRDRRQTRDTSLSARDGKSVLTLSDDFVVPDTPDPHWQVVDSDGNVYNLDKLKKKSLPSDKYQKEIVLPSYVKNVSKVIIWCAWAQTNLGEASFSSPFSRQNLNDRGADLPRTWTTAP